MSTYYCQRDTTWQAANKLQPIFERNEWEWASAGMEVPQVHEIKNHIDKLIGDLKNDEPISFASSGRITVMKIREYDSTMCYLVTLDIAQFIEEG